MISESNRYTKYLTWLVCIMALSLLIGLAIFRVNDSDTVQYLANGKHILQTGFSKDCVFNYTSETCQIPYSEWLFHVIAYSIFSASGWVGLNILQIILVLTTFIALAYGRKNTMISMLVFFIMAIFVAMERFALRADLFALLLSVLSYRISDIIANQENYIFNRSFYIKIAILFAVQILWANSHGSFPLGWGIIGAFAAGEILRSLWREKNLLHAFTPKVKVLLGLTIGSILISLLNPYGLQAITWPFKFFFGSSDFYSQLEFQSPFTPSDFPRLSTMVFRWLVALSGITLLFNLKKIKWEHIFILGTFLYLSIQHIRYIPLYAVFSALILPQYFDTLLSKITGLSKTVRDFSLSNALSVFMLLGLAYGIIQTDHSLIAKTLYLKEGRSRETGFGLSELSFPVKAADFVVKNDIQGHMFNDYASGTYINWRLFPARQSFIDGHTYTLELFRYYKDIMSGTRDYREAVKKYGINYFLVNYNSADSKNLVTKLYNDPDWSLVYYDDVAVIFLANKPANQYLIEKSLIKFKPDDKPDLAPSGNESISRSQLGYLFSSLNLSVPAAYEFDKAVQINPKNHIALTDLGAVEYNLGKRDEAYQNYQKSLKIEKHFAPTHYYLGIYYLENNQLLEAMGEFISTLKINRNYPLGNYYLGLAYETSGDKENAKKYYMAELKITGSQKAQTALVRVSSDINPESELHLKNGVDLGQKGDHAGAITEFRKAIEASPGNYLAHYNLANAYLQTSQYPQAAEEYKTTLSIQPNEPDAIFNLGYIYRYKLTDISQAKLYWEQYLNVSPNGSQAAAVREELNKLNSGQ